MKRKIFSIFLTLVLLLSFSLVTAVPAAAVVASYAEGHNFRVAEDGVAEWSIDQVNVGSYSVKLEAGTSPGDPSPYSYGRVNVYLPPTPLSALSGNPTFYAYGVIELGDDPWNQGPYLNILLDTDANGAYDCALEGVIATSADGYAVGWHVMEGVDYYETSNKFEDSGKVDELNTADLAYWQGVAPNATVVGVQIMLGYSNHTADGQVVYLDDVTIGATTYDLEPRVINTDTDEGFNAIQDAIDDADTAAGDNITVAAGTYTESLVIDVENLILNSVDGAATTTIQTGDSLLGAIPVSIMADGVTVEGFTVTGCRTEAPYGEQGAGIYLEAVDNCIIKDNILTDNYPVGINLYGGAHGDTLLEYPDNNVVTGNVITGWRDPVLGAGTSFGIKVKGTGNIISGNTISVANLAGIHVWSQEGDLDETSPPSGNVISGNTIFDIEDKTAHYRQMMAGIFFNSGDSNEISGNNIGAWVQAGIVLKDPGTWTWPTASHGNVISGNTITAGTDIGGGWFGHKGIVLIGLATGKPLADNSITGNSITGKAVGLYFENSPDNAVHFNSIVGNTFGLENDTATLDAECNWWGYITGPDIATNPYPSSGDKIIGDVDYLPWMIQVPLDAGWNIVSMPIAVESGDLPGEAIYWFNSSTQKWGTPVEMSDCSPLDAMYILTEAPDTISVCISDEPTFPASKEMKVGWNFVGLTELYVMDLEVALGDAWWGTGQTGLVGYSKVHSPSLNGDDWSYLLREEIEVGDEMSPTKGYWVFMVNDGTLGGFTTTPIVEN